MKLALLSLLVVAGLGAALPTLQRREPQINIGATIDTGMNLYRDTSVQANCCHSIHIELGIDIEGAHSTNRKPNLPC